MTKFFTILSLLLVAARVAAAMFPNTLPPDAVTTLTVVCVVVGLIALAFIGVEFYCKIKGKGKKDKD